MWSVCYNLEAVWKCCLIHTYDNQCDSRMSSAGTLRMHMMTPQSTWSPLGPARERGRLRSRCGPNTASDAVSGDPRWSLCWLAKQKYWKTKISDCLLALHISLVGDFVICCYIGHLNLNLKTLAQIAPIPSQASRTAVSTNQSVSHLKSISKWPILALYLWWRSSSCLKFVPAPICQRILPALKSRHPFSNTLVIQNSPSLKVQQYTSFLFL